MLLQGLQLVNFKCKESLSLAFHKKLCLITGHNGSGKTTVLDAIYNLCIGKSALQSQDKALPGALGAYFLLKGVFDHEFLSVVHASVAWKEGEKKKVLLNGKAHEKLADHIGKFPVVMIAPQDQDLIHLGSENRRRFFDSVICQQNPEYLEKLGLYLRLIEDRNALIKRYQETQHFDAELFDVFDEQLGSLNQFLFEQRNLFLAAFINDFECFYHKLSKRQEQVHIHYRGSSIEQPQPDLFKLNRARDVQAGRSLAGVHRDDYDLLMNGELIRRMGSQGQQKTFLIAMKLAVFEVLKRQLQITPLLLLDDIFDKLDEERVTGLLQLVSQPPFGQIFISDARPERTLHLLSLQELDVEIIHLPNL